MALAKRELPVSVDELHYKRLRVSECLSSQSPAGDVRVVLNPADCDIGDGLRGSALYEDGFAYCWSGARANIGIIRGKYCFGCKIVACQAVEMEDTPFEQQNVCRVMFVELGQAEAQRFLDEMKRELTVKPYVSPYSHENSSTSSASSQSYYFKNQGVFYHYQSPYSYRLPLQEPYGDSSSSFTYDSRQAYDVLGSFRGYECNESRGKLQLPSLGGFDDEYLCYDSGDTYSHSGSRSRHFSDGVTVDPNRSNIGESYSRTSSSLNDSYYDRLAEGSAERPVDFPATGHSSFHLTPFQHGGSSTAHNSGSPSRSFSNDVQHGRIHHQLNPLVPPTVDKPMDMHPPDGSFSTHPPHPGGAHPQPSMPAYPSQNIHMDVDHHPLHPSPFCQGS